MSFHATGAIGCAMLLRVVFASMPNRMEVATALYDRFVLRNDTGYRVHVGTVGTAGATGRTRPNRAYLRMLANCKVVVTCNPSGWEGDSRLGEALVSGALVLSDRMLDVPPGAVPGENLLFYENTTQMLAQVQAALDNPIVSARIASRGSEGASNYSQLIQRVMQVTGLLPPNAVLANATRKPKKVPVLLAVPANAMRRGETWAALELALRQSEVAQPERNASRAHAILIDNVMVEPGTRRFFKGRGGVKAFLDSIWPAVQRARASPAAREINGMRLPLVVGLDFVDSPTMTPGHDRRIDVTFKRSRVVRAQNAFSALGLRAHSLHYPVKQSVYRIIAASRRRPGAASSEWSARRFDVCCFFEPQRSARTSRPQVSIGQVVNNNLNYYYISSARLMALRYDDRLRVIHTVVIIILLLRVTYVDIAWQAVVPTGTALLALRPVSVVSR